MMTEMMQPKIEAIVRFAAVRRWHIVQTSRVQTLAEHSCTVAMLAAHIAETLHMDPARFLRWGLYHDSAEAFLGDTPTPAKNNHHSKAEEDIMTQLGIVPPDEVVKYVVKLCDLADGIRFIRIHGVDKIGLWARNNLMLRYNQMLGSPPTSCLIGSLLIQPDSIATIDEILTQFIYA